MIKVTFNVRTFVISFTNVLHLKSAFNVTHVSESLQYAEWNKVKNRINELRLQIREAENVLAFSFIEVSNFKLFLIQVSVASGKSC